jgi:thioredoxin reductase
MPYDALIVGGGPAGLQAALMLGRACRRVLLCDAGAPRNAPAAHSHGFLTRDGTPPLELLRLGRVELAAYPNVELRNVAVSDATAVDGGFEVTLEDGEAVQTRGLIVATGVRDVVPPLFRDFWGTSVFFCPYCHGWELRGQPLAVYGQDAYATHMVYLLKAWTDDVLLVPDGPLTADDATRAKLAANGIAVHEGVVVALEGDRDGLRNIRFADGTSVARRGLLYKPPTEPRSDLPARLGARFDELGLPVYVDPWHQTTVPGLYVAGDMGKMPPSVLGAAASGQLAGVGLSNALAFADAEAALGGAHVTSP